MCRLSLTLLLAALVGTEPNQAQAKEPAALRSAAIRSTPASVAGIEREGPHVFQTEQGYRVLQTVPEGDGWVLRSEQIAKSDSARIQVQVDNPAQTVFEVMLRATPTPDSAEVAELPARLLMLSDLEGEFDKFVALLRAQYVIDASLHWRFGKDHVVLVGDFVDRGELTTPLLWLLYRLDEEARVAGGRLHYVLGNHEQMMMSGRGKYWAPRQLAFAAALGDQGQQMLYGAQSVLGAWLASKPVIARVGDYLFVHGGISESFLAAKLHIDAANERARAHLFTDLASMPPGAAMILGERGVTWYRGMALRDDPLYVLEPDPSAHLDAVLKHYGCKHLAIGHSIVPDIVQEQEGRLLRLDIHHASQVPQAALLEHGQLWRVDANGGRVRLDLPSVP